MASNAFGLDPASRNHVRVQLVEALIDQAMRFGSVELFIDAFNMTKHFMASHVFKVGDFNSSGFVIFSEGVAVMVLKMLANQ